LFAWIASNSWAPSAIAKQDPEDSGEEAQATKKSPSKSILEGDRRLPVLGRTHNGRSLAGVER
jgi:hypothetical protein